MPEKIKKLTQDQRDMMPVWVKKWIDIGLCTDEADWETFEANVRKCYQFAGLNSNIPIIRVQNPLVCQIASSISASLISILQKNKNSAVDSTFYSAVGSTVGSAVRSAVGSTVGSTVDSVVRSTVDSVVRSTVGSAVGSTVYFAVDSAVDSVVRSTVYFAVGSTVGSTVDSVVRSTVDSVVRSTVDSAVGSTVGSAKKNNKLIFWHFWMGGQFWATWQSFVTFFSDVCNWSPKGDELQRLKAYELTQKSVNYWCPNKDFIIVSNRPEKINITNNQLHCDNDMAIKYRDGWGLYFFHGVKVSKDIVMTPADKLNPKLILTENNAEVKREIIRKIGIERCIKKLGAKSIEKKGSYELLNFDCIDGRFRPYLKMLNPSINTWHVEGVHPDCNTIEKALAYRNRMVEYKPPMILT